MAKKSKKSTLNRLKQAYELGRLESTSTFASPQANADSPVTSVITASGITSKKRRNTAVKNLAKKTFEEFMLDCELYLNEQSDIQRRWLERQRAQQESLNKAKEAQRIRDISKSNYQRAHRQFLRNNPEAARSITNRANLARTIQGRGGPLTTFAQNPSPSAAARAGTARATLASMGLSSLGRGAAVSSVGAAAGSGIALPIGIGVGAVALQGEMAQRQANAATRRLTGANPGEIKGLKPELIRKDYKRDVISDPGGVGGKVSTNTGYKAKVGGWEGTSTRDSAGKRTFKVENLPRATPFSITNPSTWIAPRSGVKYKAKLGKTQGMMTYDSSGKGTFKAVVGPTQKRT